MKHYTAPAATVPKEKCPVILVVDDDSSRLRAMRYMLEDGGLPCLTATCRWRAQELMREMQPRVVLGAAHLGILTDVLPPMLAILYTRPRVLTAGAFAVLPIEGIEYAANHVLEAVRSALAAGEMLAA
jgi:CheY-like chemotaxis protein